uniref:Nematode cuticle collagen N-terminal domain-containing protein n=1 Tax=Parascaris equorum TaxID=6256 RepID=A0A914RCZ7_PAREQ
MDVRSRVNAYRLVAYAAITFSFVAILTICVTLSIVYNYIHHVRKQMHVEIAFCKPSYASSR